MTKCGVVRRCCHNAAVEGRGTERQDKWCFCSYSVVNRYEQFRCEISFFFVVAKNAKFIFFARRNEKEIWRGREEIIIICHIFIFPQQQKENVWKWNFTSCHSVWCDSVIKTFCAFAIFIFSFKIRKYFYFKFFAEFFTIFPFYLIY